MTSDEERLMTRNVSPKGCFDLAAGEAFAGLA